MCWRQNILNSLNNTVCTVQGTTHVTKILSKKNSCLLSHPKYGRNRILSQETSQQFIFILYYTRTAISIVENEYIQPKVILE